MIRVLLSLFVASQILIFAGCDDGTYARRFNERLEKNTRESGIVFYLADARRGLRDSSETVSGVDIRFPKIFDSSRKEYGPDAQDRQNSTPEREKLPGLDFPGFRYSMERHAGNKEDADYYLPVYAYAFCTPISEMTLEQYKTTVTEILSTSFSKNVTWSFSEFENLQGETALWSRIELSSTQPFLMIYKDGKDEDVMRDGFFKFYVAANETHIIMIAFRYPAELMDRILPAAPGDPKDFLKACEASIKSASGI